jgi:hypothetical protein
VRINLTLENFVKAQRGKNYSFTLSLISALDGGGWPMPHLGRLTSRKETPVSDGWAPGPVWTFCGREKSLGSAGTLTPDRPALFRL